MQLTTKFLATAAVVATVASATLASAPAQAAIIAGSSIQFGTPLGGGVNTGGGTLDFTSPNAPTLGVPLQGTAVSNGSGSFSFANNVVLRLVATNLTASVKDIPFTVGAPVNDFFKANFYTNPATGLFGGNFLGLQTFVPVSFRLDNFLYNAATGVGSGKGLLTKGLDTSEALFQFSTQLIGQPPTSYSATITAVPTPALLPGLIGLGLSVVRKRKAEAKAEA
jgi:hypothetical protein